MLRPDTLHDIYYADWWFRTEVYCTPSFLPHWEPLIYHRMIFPSPSLAYRRTKAISRAANTISFFSPAPRFHFIVESLMTLMSILFIILLCLLKFLKLTAGFAAIAHIAATMPEIRKRAALEYAIRPRFWGQDSRVKKVVILLHSRTRFQWRAGAIYLRKNDCIYQPAHRKETICRRFYRRQCLRLPQKQKHRRLRWRKFHTSYIDAARLIEAVKKMNDIPHMLLPLRLMSFRRADGPLNVTVRTTMVVTRREAPLDYYREHASSIQRWYGIFTIFSFITSEPRLALVFDRAVSLLAIHARWDAATRYFSRWAFRHYWGAKIIAFLPQSAKHTSIFWCHAFMRLISREYFTMKCAFIVDIREDFRYRRDFALWDDFHHVLQSEYSL